MTTDQDAVTLAAIRERHRALSGFMVWTPTVRLHSPVIDRLLEGGELFLKLECFQHTGTFKARGALSVAHSLPPEVAARGFTAASAGNHAIAVAWSARQLGVSAKVAMQSSANPLRVARARAEGAEIIVREGGPATFAEAERLRAEENRTFIHPFEGLGTTLGAAGVGLELVEDVPGMEAVVVSVGGGGLISGVAAAVKLGNPACAVYGVEPAGAAAVTRGLATGAPVRLEVVDTVADSLGPPMSLPFSLSVIRRHVDEIVTMDDDGITAGMAALQELAMLAVEPAAGAAMAGALGPLRDRLKGKRTAIVVCGSNIDAESYARLHERGRRGLASLLR